MFLDKYSNYYCSYSETGFNKSIKELEDTFISNSRLLNNSIITQFQNPSIFDFLCHYFTDNTKIVERIVDTALFINQLFEIFGNNLSQSTLIKANIDILEKRKSMIVNNYDKLQYLSVVISWKNDKTYYRPDKSMISKLYYMLKKLSDDEINQLGKKLSCILLNINAKGIKSDEIEEYLYSIKILKEHCFAELLDMKVFDILFENIKTDSDLLYLKPLKEIDIDLFNKYVNSEIIVEKIISICRESESDYSDNNLQELRDNLEEISNCYGLDLDDILESIDEKISEYEEKTSHYEPDYDSMRKEKRETDYINDSVIVDMFNSLLESSK
jgi:hypothetical protein